MDYIFAIGPLGDEDDSDPDFWVAFRCGEDDMESVTGESARACVEALRASGKPMRLASDLASVARALSLESGPLPEDVAALRGIMAVVLANAEVDLRPSLDLEVGDFLDASVKLLLLDLESFSADELLRFERREGKRTVEYGLQLQSNEGALEMTVVREPSKALYKRSAAKSSVEILAVRFEPATAPFATALAEGFGLTALPLMMHVKGDKPAKVGAKELEILTDAIAALLEERALSEVASAESKAAEASWPEVGRNEPCPCGSGKKYKKCHLAQQRSQSGGAEAHPIHELDQRLRGELIRFAETRWPGWLDRQMLSKDGEDTPAEDQLRLAWSLFVIPSPAGVSVAGAFMDEHQGRLSAQMRGWLGAQLAARLSIWEVVKTDPGRGRIHVADLSTGERRELQDVGMAKALRPREGFLARIADAGDVAVLVGAHGQPLPPPYPDEALDVWAQSEARSPEILLAAWRAASVRCRTPDKAAGGIRNADGDAIVLCEQRFRLRHGELARALLAIGQIPGAEVRRSDHDGQIEDINFRRPGPGQLVDWLATSLGHVWVEDGALVLGTNSRERATAIASQLAAQVPELEAAGPRTEHPAPIQGGSGQTLEAHPTTSFVHELVLREVEHAWYRHPIPALDGRTPVAAMADETGRRALHRLLKREEWFAARRPEPDAIEAVRSKRARLGLDDDGRPVAPRPELSKLSDALLVLVAPILADEGVNDFAEAKRWLELAQLIWNACVLAESGRDPEPRAELQNKREAVFDLLLSRRAALYSGDLRLIHEVQVLDTGVRVMSSPLDAAPEAKTAKARSPRSRRSASR